VINDGAPSEAELDDLLSKTSSIAANLRTATKAGDEESK
jgi:hypothetical protein